MDEKKEVKMRPGKYGGSLKSGGSKSPGRPKKIPELRELINNVMGEESSDGKTAMEAVIMRLRKQAIEGNNRAAELLLKYAYGLPGQTIELKTSDESEGGFFIALPSNARDKPKKDAKRK
jgi:hypothetical protein